MHAYSCGFSAAAEGFTDIVGSAQNQDTGATCPSDSTLTYANFGQAFMSAHCTSCHSGRESPNLTTQAQVKASTSAIIDVAGAGPNGTNTAMPEGSTLTVEQRTQLAQWLTCGAP